MEAIQVLLQPLTKETIPFYKTAITNSKYLLDIFRKKNNRKINKQFYSSQLETFREYQNSLLSSNKLKDSTSLELEAFVNCIYSSLYHIFNFYFIINRRAVLTKRDFESARVELNNWIRTIETVQSIQILIDDHVLQRDFADALFLKKFYEKGFNDALALLQLNAIDLRICPLNYFIVQTQKVIRKSIDNKEIELLSKFQVDKIENPFYKFIINVGELQKQHFLDELVNLYRDKSKKSIVIAVFLLIEKKMLNVITNNAEFVRALNIVFNYTVLSPQYLSMTLKELPHARLRPGVLYIDDIKEGEAIIENLAKFKI
jgi:hypothetical protein